MDTSFSERGESVLVEIRLECHPNGNISGQEIPPLLTLCLLTCMIQREKQGTSITYKQCCYLLIHDNNILVNCEQKFATSPGRVLSH